MRAYPKLVSLPEGTDAPSVQALIWGGVANQTESCHKALRAAGREGAKVRELTKAHKLVGPGIV